MAAGVVQPVEPAVDPDDGARLVALEVQRGDVELVVELGELGEHHLVAAVEEEPVDRVGAHATADVVAGLEERDRETLAREQPGARQPGEATAHDAHVGSTVHRQQSPTARAGAAKPRSVRGVRGCGARGRRW